VPQLAGCQATALGHAYRWPSSSPPGRRDGAGHSGRVTTATTHFSLRADSVKRLCPGAARSADLTL